MEEERSILFNIFHHYLSYANQKSSVLQLGELVVPNRYVLMIKWPKFNLVFYIYIIIIDTIFCVVCILDAKVLYVWCCKYYKYVFSCEIWLGTASLNDRIWFILANSWVR